MEHGHIVGRFDKDLKKIVGKVIAMGELVIAQLGAATEVLAVPDVEVVARIVATDRKVNGMERVITNRAERLITLRQPMALDLRAALSPISIAGDLERIGDHAKSTAKRARKMGGNAIPAEHLAILMQMSELVQRQLGDVLDAYHSSDIELAAVIRDRDKKVDALNNALFKLAVATLSNPGNDTEALTNAVLISRNFERAGDHVANVAGYVIHIVTGNDPSEMGQPH